MSRSAVLEGLKKWILPVLSDRSPFRLERQQRSFKSDSGLGSEFEIGRRNSRGHACPLAPFHRGGSTTREWCTCRGSTVLWMGTHTWFERSIPIRSIPLSRGSWVNKKEKKWKKGSGNSAPRGGEEKRRRRRRGAAVVDGKGWTGRTGWTGAKEKVKNKKKKRCERDDGKRRMKGRRKKKKRWNSVVYPVIYNWKLGTTRRTT